MAWNTTADCARSRSLGLVRGQRRLCHNNLDMMQSVVGASRDTVDICQEMFADRRWNCSTIQRAPHFLPDLAGSKPAPRSPKCLLTRLVVRLAGVYRKIDLRQ